jgi:hypothetical protein
MKNTIVVLTVLFLNMQMFAQPYLGKPANTSFNNDLFHTKLKSVLRPANNNNFLLLSNHKQFDFKRFLEIYRLHQKGMLTNTKKVTFMDGPVMFPISYSDNSQKATISYQSYSSTNPNIPLTILGIVGGIVAGAAYPSHIINQYPSNDATEAYLKSTYHQHHK